MNVQRYEWEDALMEAESLGLLPAGAVTMCLRLAKAITWEPKNGRPSGLYWKNEDALQSVKSSKATYHRYRESLFAVGFFVEVSGNLIPQVPDLSQTGTVQSQVESEQSHIETGESQADSPYTVDIYTGDSFTEDEYTVATGLAVADAPTVPVSTFAESKANMASSLMGKTVPVLEVGDEPKSQSETVDDWDDWTPPVKQTVAPVADPDPIPANAATRTPCERELSECRRRWAMSGETGWKAAKARMAEEAAIRECHGVEAPAW